MALDDSRGQDVDDMGWEAADVVGDTHKHTGALEVVVALNMHLPLSEWWGDGEREKERGT